MTEQERAEQIKALVNLRRHVELAEEKYKLPLPVAEHIDSAWFEIEAAVREVKVDWGERRRVWEQGEGIRSRA